MQWAVGEALGVYRDSARWAKMQAAGMARDFSWDASARKYEQLYRSLVKA